MGTQKSSIHVLHKQSTDTTHNRTGEGKGIVEHKQDGQN